MKADKLSWPPLLLFLLFLLLLLLKCCWDSTAIFIIHSYISSPDWFPGWMYKGTDVVNAQPNDDGFSGQDCVELRQRFSSYSGGHGKNLEINSISVKDSFVPVTSNEKFYWNDRHCETKNFYLCEKATHQSKQEILCFFLCSSTFCHSD